MALMNDFALLDHPATMINVVIALAILTTFFCETSFLVSRHTQKSNKKADNFVGNTAVIGFLIAQMGWMSQRMERQSARNHLNTTQCITMMQGDNQTLRSKNASASTLVADIELDYTDAGKRFNTTSHAPAEREV